MRRGPLTVAAGESLCLGPGSSSHGPITVRPGGAVAVTGAELNGPLSSDGALAFVLCGTTVHGPVTVRGTAGVHLVGPPDGDPQLCAVDTVRGPVRVERPAP
ncbi:hypothetical protein ACWGB8_35880 [Kitasatospora sp. NPDC054939]